MSELIHTPDAMLNRGSFLAVGPAMLDALKQRAEVSPRKRFRLCLHSGPEAAVQEMIIASQQSAFCRPHCHPDSAASVLVLDGRVQSVVFDTGGAVLRKVTLGPPGGPLPCCTHFAAGCWHMDVVLTAMAVIYETAAGPFIKGKSSVFPPWAPDEADAAGIAALLARVAAAAEEGPD